MASKHRIYIVMINVRPSAQLIIKSNQRSSFKLLSAKKKKPPSLFFLITHLIRTTKTLSWEGLWLNTCHTSRPLPASNHCPGPSELAPAPQSGVSWYFFFPLPARHHRLQYHMEAQAVSFLCLPPLRACSPQACSAGPFLLPLA